MRESNSPLPRRAISAVRSSDAGDSRIRQPVRVQLANLLEGGREAIIVHNGEDYRLRVTANGKLILTK